jgi:hypothetical protein
MIEPIHSALDKVRPLFNQLKVDFKLVDIFPLLKLARLAKWRTFNIG